MMTVQYGKEPIDLAARYRIAIRKYRNACSERISRVLYCIGEQGRLCRFPSRGSLCGTASSCAADRPRATTAGGEAQGPRCSPAS